MQKEKLKSIILKVTEEYKAEILDIVKNHPDYNHLTMASFIRKCINKEIKEIKG